MRLRVPPQGTLTIQDIVEYLKSTGALNVKYDANLDGVVDKAADADTVGGHAPGTAAGDVLVLNTAGQVPLTNLPLLPASQLDFSFAWELAGSIKTSTAAASISFSSLAGDTDKVYLLFVAASNPSTAATGGIFLRLNADATLGNYAWVSFSDTGTAASSSQSFGATTGVAGINFGGLGGSGAGFWYSFVYAEGITVGTKTYIITSTYGFDTSVRFSLGSGAWVKSAEVDEITLFTRGGVAVNWVAYLFKPKW